jgi:hypothetical protein
MFHHLRSHSNIVTQVIDGGNKATFRCPLFDYKGERCLHELNLDDSGGKDFRFHFSHKGTDREQEQVQLAGQGEVAQNPVTKAQMGNANPELLKKACNERSIGVVRARRTRKVTDVVKKVSLLPSSESRMTSSSAANTPSTSADEESSTSEDELVLKRPAKATPKKCKQANAEKNEESSRAMAAPKKRKMPAEIPAKKKLKKTHMPQAVAA